MPAPVFLVLGEWSSRDRNRGPVPGPILAWRPAAVLRNSLLRLRIAAPESRAAVGRIGSIFFKKLFALSEAMKSPADVMHHYPASFGR